MLSIAELTHQLINGPSVETGMGGDNPYLPPLKDAIEHNDINAYIEALVQVSKLRLSDFERTNMLVILVKLITELKSQIDNAFLDITLKAYVDPQDPDDISPVIGRLFGLVSCDISTLKSIVDRYPEITPLEIVESQLHSNIVSVNFILQRFDEIYGSDIMGRNEVNYLLSKSVDDEGKDTIITNFLRSRFSTIDNVRPKPEWVSIASNETSQLLNWTLWTVVESESLCPYVPTYNSGTTQALSRLINDNLADYKISDSDGGKVSFDDLEDMATAIVNVSEEKCEIKYPGNPDRMFGPMNRLINSDCISGIIRGGCRMLTCRCKDYDRELDEYDDYSAPRSPDGWFNGECNYCNWKIRDISYALRYPLIGGAFYGCYCSEDCMFSAHPSNEDAASEFVLSAILDKISVNGIIDRYALRQTSNTPDVTATYTSVADMRQALHALFKAESSTNRPIDLSQIANKFQILPSS